MYNHKVFGDGLGRFNPGTIHRNILDTRQTSREHTNLYSSRSTTLPSRSSPLCVRRVWKGLWQGYTIKDIFQERNFFSSKKKKRHFETGWTFRDFYSFPSVLRKQRDTGEGGCLSRSRFIFQGFNPIPRQQPPVTTLDRIMVLWETPTDPKVPHLSSTPQGTLPLQPQLTKGQGGTPRVRQGRTRVRPTMFTGPSVWSGRTEETERSRDFCRRSERSGTLMRGQMSGRRGRK